jgi:hypothetical protein
MVVAWLVLGAVVGGSGSLCNEGPFQTAVGIVAGMFVLPVPGLFLGLIGGDVKGSFVGAAGGILGCWLSGLASAAPIQVPSMKVMMVFGALAGATFVIYLRLGRWMYGTTLRRTWQLIGGTRAIDKVAASLYQFRSNRLTPGNLAPFVVGPRLLMRLPMRTASVLNRRLR